MKMSHNNQKKIAAINDISGFGRCSTTVSMPIISYMRVQYCPVPTSIFSNHTGYEDYFFDDYTDKMESYIAKWKKLDLRFEGIYTGFLGSVRQIEIVKKFIKEFQDQRTQVIVDPVMGDDGKKYTTYTQEMCEQMRELVKMADIITPNLTEACILTGTVYRAHEWKQADLETLAGRLCDLGPEKIVITGLQFPKYVGNYVYEKGKGGKLLRTKK